MLSLIIAGIASIPFIGWAICTLSVLTIVAAPPLLFLLYRGNNKNNDEITACNVIITGGSSGIGLGIARECCSNEQVKCITLIARNKDKLERAREELLQVTKQQSHSTEIQVVSADVTDYKTLEQACQSITMCDSTFLFVCAGVSHPGYFSEIPPDVFERQMKLNYLGSVYTVKAILPNMKRGCITLTSSAAGQVGVYGFTAYSPTKFALRGFAECLHMELSNTPVNVQLAFPNDTNTPGYQEEKELKPKECHLISESCGLSEASEYVTCCVTLNVNVLYTHSLIMITSIATKMVREAMKPNPPFCVWFGFEGWMLTALTAGMSPVTGVVDGISQVGLMGLFRFISLFYLNDFWNIVKKCAGDEKSNENGGIVDSTAQDKKEQ